MTVFALIKFSQASDADEWWYWIEETQVNLYSSEQKANIAMMHELDGRPNMVNLTEENNGLGGFDTPLYEVRPLEVL